MSVPIPLVERGLLAVGFPEAEFVKLPGLTINDFFNDLALVVATAPEAPPSDAEAAETAQYRLAIKHHGAYVQAVIALRAWLLDSLAPSIQSLLDPSGNGCMFLRIDDFVPLLLSKYGEAMPEDLAAATVRLNAHRIENSSLAALGRYMATCAPEIRYLTDQNRPPQEEETYVRLKTAAVAVSNGTYYRPVLDAISMSSDRQSRTAAHLLAAMEQYATSWPEADVAPPRPLQSNGAASVPPPVTASPAKDTKPPHKGPAKAGASHRGAPTHYCHTHGPTFHSGVQCTSRHGEHVELLTEAPADCPLGLNALARAQGKMPPLQRRPRSG
jgi:hypothetical protein